MRGVAAGCYEVFGCAGQVCRGWMKGAVCCDVAAVLREGRIIDGRVPITALPASNPGAQCVCEVVIVSGAISRTFKAAKTQSSRLLGTWFMF